MTDLEFGQIPGWKPAHIHIVVVRDVSQNLRFQQWQKNNDKDQDVGEMRKEVSPSCSDLRCCTLKSAGRHPPGWLELLRLSPMTKMVKMMLKPFFSTKTTPLSLYPSLVIRFCEVESYDGEEWKYCDSHDWCWAPEELCWSTAWQRQRDARLHRQGWARLGCSGGWLGQLRCSSSTSTCPPLASAPGCHRWTGRPCTQANHHSILSETQNSD